MDQSLEEIIKAKGGFGRRGGRGRGARGRRGSRGGGFRGGRGNSGGGTPVMNFKRVGLKIAILFYYIVVMW